MAIAISQFSYTETVSFLEDIYIKCAYYEDVVRHSRKEMIGRFNVAVNEVMTGLEEGRRTNKIKKQHKVVDKLENPIISVLEKAKRSLELLNDRKMWRLVFCGLIDNIKNIEQERYSTPPFLYKIFEKAYEDLSRRGFLPIVWDQYSVKWMIDSAHSREIEFFMKNKRSSYREMVFKQLVDIFDLKSNKAKVKEKLNNLFLMVKMDDNVLGNFLEDIIKNWIENGILSDSTEDIMGNTYAKLHEQRKQAEARKFQLEKNYVELKNKIRSRIIKSKETIKPFLDVLDLYPNLRKSIDLFWEVDQFTFIKEEGHCDVVKLKSITGCYYLGVLGRVIAESQFIEKNIVDGRVKEAARKFGFIVENTYLELVEEGILPTKFEYYRFKLKEDVVKIFEKYKNSSWIKINKKQYAAYQQLLDSIDHSDKISDLKHAVRVAKITSQENHEASSSIAQLNLPFRKVSRFYQALSYVEKVNTDWLSFCEDPIVFAVESEIKKYFSGKYFYHNRTRRQQANDLIKDLYMTVYKNSGDEEKVRIEQWKVMESYIGIIKSDNGRKGILSKIFKIPTENRLAEALETVYKSKICTEKTVSAILFYNKQLPVIKSQLAILSTEYRKLFPKMELRTDSLENGKNDPFSQVELLQGALGVCKSKKEAELQFNLIIGRVKEMLKDEPSLIEAFKVAAGYETPLLTLDRLLKNAYQNLVDLQVFDAAPRNKKDVEELSYIAREVVAVSDEIPRLKEEQERYSALAGIPKSFKSHSL